VKNSLGSNWPERTQTLNIEWGQIDPKVTRRVNIQLVVTAPPAGQNRISSLACRHTDVDSRFYFQGWPQRRGNNRKYRFPVSGDFKPVKVRREDVKEGKTKKILNNLHGRVLSFVITSMQIYSLFTRQVVSVVRDWKCDSSTTREICNHKTIRITNVFYINIYIF